MIREKRKRKRKSFLLLLVVLSFKRITYQKVTVHLIDETFGKKIQIEYLMMWSFNQQKSSPTVKDSFHFISFYSIIKEIQTIEYDKHFFFFLFFDCKGILLCLYFFLRFFQCLFFCSFDVLLMFFKQTNLMYSKTYRTMYIII